ncbi:S24 family peptidase [Phocaeicola vulgatus]|jgi:phage repressor protein C with HTH and peptisase S24 domain|uniref:S24 family peptidase n=1 Tax=Phocaeicola vulgatus TaxID=821 RepID=UPI00125CCB51|nr:S24 family peptidase [Phocaeicola vulgatus]KAB5426057.1 S24 family peptidase [Phocaeicola vulgatus]
MENISTIKDRILTFLESEGIKKADFYSTTGISDSNFKGKNLSSQLGGDAIVKVLTSYPNLSADWLLVGAGSMLKDDLNGIQTADEANPSTLPTTSMNPSVGTPYYDVDFIGGFDEVFNSQVNIPATNIVIRGFEKASLWCNVTGHSMEPKINHGDIIALHQCTLNDIQYGEIYAVVLDTIRTIKILRRSPDPDKLRFIPINTNDYDEQEFDKSRIINVFEVIGSISKFF